MGIRIGKQNYFRHNGQILTNEIYWHEEQGWWAVTKYFATVDEAVDYAKSRNEGLTVEDCREKLKDI